MRLSWPSEEYLIESRCPGLSHQQIISCRLPQRVKPWGSLRIILGEGLSYNPSQCTTLPRAGAMNVSSQQSLLPLLFIPEYLLERKWNTHLLTPWDTYTCMHKQMCGYKNKIYILLMFTYMYATCIIIYNYIYAYVCKLILWQ